MDAATLIGFIIAFGTVLFGFLLEGGSLGALLSPSAALIVFGGSLGATILSFTLKHTLNIHHLVRITLFYKRPDQLATIKTIVDLAKRARQAGILGLEAEIKTIENPFLRRAIQSVVDGMQPEMVREIMEIEIEAMRARHKLGEDFFTSLGGYTPTLGVIGTVMGLVHMLDSLDKPGAMGPAIATAFIATLYGVMSANLLFIPIATKLRGHSLAESKVYEMAIEGILSLQAGDNPRVVGMKMRSFLSPQDRQKLDAGGE